jgi:hypothetical protein
VSSGWGHHGLLLRARAAQCGPRIWMTICQLLLIVLARACAQHRSGARRQARLEAYRTSDLLCFHLVVLLLERVDFAADHLDLLDMAGDCRRNVSTCLFASPSDATSGTMAGLERRKRLPAAQ